MGGIAPGSPGGEEDEVILELHGYYVRTAETTRLHRFDCTSTKTGQAKNYCN